MLAVRYAMPQKAVTAAVEWPGELPLAAGGAFSAWYLIVALVLPGC